MGSETCLFSETEIFTSWINSLQQGTHVKSLGFSIFFLYSYNSGYFCFNGLFWSACARELEANYHMLQICSCNAKFDSSLLFSFLWDVVILLSFTEYKHCYFLARELNQSKKLWFRQHRK